MNQTAVNKESSYNQSIKNYSTLKSEEKINDAYKALLKKLYAQESKQYKKLEFSF